MVHISSGRNPTHIGDDVTVGHRAILHGCTLEHHCLIGMGAIILDRAVIGDHAIVGAGALVTQGTQVPPGTLVIGSPAKVRREITDDERRMLQQSALHYAELAQRYRKD